MGATVTVNASGEILSHRALTERTGGLIVMVTFTIQSGGSTHPSTADTITLVMHESVDTGVVGVVAVNWTAVVWPAKKE